MTRKTRHDMTLSTQKLVCLAAYTAPMAKVADHYCDVILVGDSLGMVIYGMENTLNVSIDMMINHGRAVVNATQHAMIVVDMPFASYQESPEIAFRNAAHIIAETNCQAVKLEGGQTMAETVAFLTKRGIAVMGHVGMTPQHVNQYGGFKVQGRNQQDHDMIIADALAIEAAGAYAIVLEAITPQLAKEITERLSIPTIGIGASGDCSGQILVVDDMLGIHDGYTPKFARKFASLHDDIDRGIRDYADHVRAETFPNAHEIYKS